MLKLKVEMKLELWISQVHKCFTMIIMISL